MREMHMTAWCDACQSRRKQTKVDPEDSQVTIDLGNGPQTLDLCKPDRKALLAPLEKLLEDYGVVVPVAQGNGKPLPAARRYASQQPRPGDWPCPKCSERRTTRVSVIHHMESLHGMDTVAASRLAPPKQDPVECPLCGYVAQLGTGITSHAISAHGNEEWQRIKADVAVKK